MSKVYQVITDKIIESLERGTVPWQKPWQGHANLISKKQYRGINAFMTSAQGYDSPYWLTYKQAQELGGQVRKGQKSTPIVYWYFGEKENATTGKKKSFGVPMYSSVFNIDQIDGLDLTKIPTPQKMAIGSIETCDAIVNGYKNAPVIVHKDLQAYYMPKMDFVNMPPKHTFSSVAGYYSTLFHELGHSTGHQKRLARDGIVEMNHFGSHSYSKEELVAEMTAAFLCAHAGIENNQLEQSAAYIESWLKALKGDSKMVMQAASQAQKAADMILGVEMKGVENE